MLLLRSNTYGKYHTEMCLSSDFVQRVDLLIEKRLLWRRHKSFGSAVDVVLFATGRFRDLLSKKVKKQINQMLITTPLNSAKVG